MTRKDYEAAAAEIQTTSQMDVGQSIDTRFALIETFVRFFREDNPRFDAERFRKACVPGANVKARR